jgi:bacteriocin biosynthesis cyclodehydratase domain-containing protein
MKKSGRPWMLYKASGSMPLFGPIFQSDSKFCWSCLASHLRENRPGDIMINSVDAIRPSRAYTQSSINLATELIAFEIVRLVTSDNHELKHNVLSFDMKNILLDLNLIVMFVIPRKIQKKFLKKPVNHWKYHLI